MELLAALLIAPDALGIAIELEALGATAEAEGMAMPTEPLLLPGGRPELGATAAVTGG
jgi:hypothetical protein